MANDIKDQQDILKKLNIHKLNPMQEEAIAVIEKTTNTILLSPTGTGKTLAFLLPLIEALDPENPDVQAIILVPSRELAIQIEQVARTMGTGFKVNAVYGGRSMSKDKIEIKHVPAILIGTPGRILDHFSNDRFSKASIKTLILDEFDKSLEDGFEETETEGYDDELSVESDAAVFTRDSNKGNKDDNTSKSAVVPKSFWSLEDYRDTGVMSDDDDESVARCYDKDDVAPDEAEKDSNDGATKLSTSVINLTPPRFLLPRVSEEANDGGGSTKKQSSEDESPSNKLYSSFNQELKHDEASTEDETPVDEDKVTGQPEKQLLLLLDAPYGSHTKLFEGPQDKASDNVDVLSGELSGVKFKSDQARKDPAEALNAILDMSYLKSGVHAAKILGNTTTSNNDVHRKRVMFVLDNPKRAEALVAMCHRNDEDIDLPDLMRQFDFFSSF